MTSGLVRVSVCITGIVLGLMALLMAVNESDRASAADETALAFKLFVGNVSRDEPNPSVSPPPISSPSPTPTPTATTTPTATRTPTATSTPQGSSAYALVTSWYAHINDTLYGRYTAILAQQTSGQLTPTQAGAALTAEKAFPDAFKVFLDGQTTSLSGASPACNYARQTLGLAAGYLGLMEGWGGMILTYGPTPTYFSSREDASNKYFEFMSESLGHIANCSGSASGGGTPPPLPPPSAPALSTPTPTFQPTATPPSGGSTGCLARSVTWDWELCVRESYLDLFEIRVTALTEDATDSSFKIRVYAPDDFLGTDSSTKWPFYVGQTFRLDYGFDFFEYEPYPVGIYEIELRVDFLRETRVYINVY